jgi:hypothetical protein
VSNAHCASVSAPTSKSTSIVNSGHNICLVVFSNASIEHVLYSDIVIRSTVLCGLPALPCNPQSDTNICVHGPNFLPGEYTHASTNTTNIEDGEMTGWGSLGRSGEDWGGHGQEFYVKWTMKYKI